jgi:hypothetical protein
MKNAQTVKKGITYGGSFPDEEDTGYDNTVHVANITNFRDVLHNRQIPSISV